MYDASGDDSCQWYNGEWRIMAYNGECDVPQYCAANTDTTDCGGEFYRVAFVRAALGQLTQSGSTRALQGPFRRFRALHHVHARRVWVCRSDCGQLRPQRRAHGRIVRLRLCHQQHQRKLQKIGSQLAVISELQCRARRHMYSLHPSAMVLTQLWCSDAEHLHSGGEERW